ncbi:hypothetical protein GOEFS_110_00570 [Gordonia effusa NBRC 100432]|uniref:Lipoprotein n=1 Tax=Gordonia effusa NBRC 100432 TaxID=1077974 RepID=H0R5H7_9ACTN|nr:hypothetical protein [Gordonia effusa]GAB20328.1 hypothetical protein GOEFS_110_00570 [Gordonia effusa NBRC 100432]
MRLSGRIRRTAVAVIVVAATAVGGAACARAPGGPQGELSKVAADSASALASTQIGLTAWEHRRIRRSQLTVLVDDMVGQAVTAYGAAATLKVESHDDAQLRDAVMVDLGTACEVLVGFKQIVGSAPEGQHVPASALSRILDRLRHVADDPASATAGKG